MKEPYCPICGCTDFEYDQVEDQPNDAGYYITCQGCGAELFFWEHMEVTSWIIQESRYGKVLLYGDAAEDKPRGRR